MATPGKSAVRRDRGSSPERGRRAAKPADPRKISRALAPSPLGPLLLEATDIGIMALKLPNGQPHPPPGPPPRGAAARHLAAARRQLAEYFSGRRRRFDVPLDPAGTDSQKRIWDHLTRIPYGTTLSYDEVAERLGEVVSQADEVEGANKTNPIPIVIPCHRVVQEDGSLGPYAGGSPEIKWRLLQLEGIAPLEN